MFDGVIVIHSPYSEVVTLEELVKVKFCLTENLPVAVFFYDASIKISKIHVAWPVMSSL
jgi:hypothetical protein